MKVFHLSAECYPVAKVGGLADVVGALPKYLRQQGIEASVVLPKYRNDWIRARTFEAVHEGEGMLGGTRFSFSIEREKEDSLGFPLYMIDIPGRFDRRGVYADPASGKGYQDEAERYISFQIAVLDWFRHLAEKDRPDLVHCHDHHAGLVPFMMTQCYRYDELKIIPTVLTVHNGEYHGEYDRNKDRLLPDFDLEKGGLLDWDGRLNALAAGLKCAWQISTVSPSYLKELQKESHGLEWLFMNERQKSRGILNGIDTDVWDPQADSYLDHHYSAKSFADGKAENKRQLCEGFGLNEERPLISYIGRLAYEKGADLLPDLFGRFLRNGSDVSFVVLGTGDPELHKKFMGMSSRHVGFFDATLDYNEELAHRIYAGSDFLIMPSRVEPCGLNQMYAMRYGTVPIVRSTGGLKDTVVDMGKKKGTGIRFDGFTLQEAAEAIERALKLYGDKEKLESVRKRIMKLDFSWNASAKEYIKMYNHLLND